MGCSTCAKIFLVLINIIFVLIGLGLLTVGCMLKLGQVDLLNEQLMNLMSSVDGKVIADGSVDLGSLVGKAAVALIISGVIIFIIGFLGMCGAMCTIKWMLCLYAVIITVIILAEVVGVILLFTMTAQIEGFIQSFLRGTLKKSYAGAKSNDAASLAWNYAFTELQCCGVTNYTDTHLATKWNRTVQDPITSAIRRLETPLTCCKLNGTFPDYELPSSYDCAVTPVRRNSNYDTDCYSAVKDIVLGYKGIFIGVGVGILVLELLLLISSILAYKSEDSKVGSM
ncbi:tetraspanin-9-like [Liolophura sinensis]|uniref:tetraspanin-9-like n=1 Tax=Liolophura sinensis TaxID=3198878 RepID=UPI0031587811